MQVCPTVRMSVAIIYFLTISFLFFLPGTAFPKNDWFSQIHFDKWVHFGIFAMLVWVLFWASGNLEKMPVFWFIILVAAYGLLIEILQHLFVPNRAFDIWDWLADVLGCIAGIWTWGLKKNRPL